MSRKRARVLVTIGAALVWLLLVELLLRVAFPLTYQVRSPDGQVIKWEASRPYACRRDTRVWELDFAENATAEDVTAWDSGRPYADHQGTQFFRHPVRGWDCGSEVRGRDQRPTSWKPSTRLRVLAVGDSFTFGSDVRPEEAWCRRLEQSMDGAEVLNCGVPGYGVDQIALKLEEHAPPLKPDVVIWGLVSYDVERAGRSWFPKSWMPKPTLSIVGDSWTVTPPRTRAEVLEEVSGPTLRVALVARACADLIAYPSWVSGCNDLFRDLVRLSWTRVQGWGGRLIVLYLPTGGPLLREDDSTGEALMQMCREVGVEVVDVRAAIRNMHLSDEQLSKLTLLPEGRGHYSAAGNALVAKVVRDYLQTSAGDRWSGGTRDGDDRR